MKRLIRLSNDESLDKLISDLSTFIAKGIDGMESRSELDNIIPQVLDKVPASNESGTFYRGLILDYTMYDFLEKIPKFNDIVNAVEEFNDEDHPQDEIETEKQKYADTQLPQDVVEEIKNVCMSELRQDDSYYSFSTSFDACKNFVNNAAPQAYDGEISFIFKCNTDGLDVSKLNDAIDDLDITDETKSKFKDAYKSFGYQKEVICRAENPEICMFENMDLDKGINMLEAVSKFYIYFY